MKILNQLIYICFLASITLFANFVCGVLFNIRFRGFPDPSWEAVIAYGVLSAIFYFINSLLKKNEN
jgi:hypothetical protein